MAEMTSASFWDMEDSLGSYLTEIASSRPLSGSDEVNLARRIKAGDESARNRLVEANLRFVVSVAKEYQNRGVPLPDLISAGNMGLITAAERFDEEKGFKFISRRLVDSPGYSPNARRTIPHGSPSAEQDWTSTKSRRHLAFATGKGRRSQS